MPISPQWYAEDRVDVIAIFVRSARTALRRQDYQQVLLDLEAIEQMAVSEPHYLEAQRPRIERAIAQAMRVSQQSEKDA